MQNSQSPQKLYSVSEVGRFTGISITTLRYYDEIGLLPPTEVTPAGYRLYDEEALHRLQCIAPLFYNDMTDSLPWGQINRILCFMHFISHLPVE